MKQLAVYFPGIGYHVDKPLLYYAKQVANGAGYLDTIQVSYKFAGGNIRGDKEKMRETFLDLYRQAEACLAKVEWEKYREILFISKSIGTVISATYAKKHQISCRQILYTPLEETYEFQPKEAIAFLGDQDPWSRVEEVFRISKEQEVPIYRYEGANHSLEVEDSLKNLEILKDVMEKTASYLG